jgi:hypothetical protein
MRLSFVRDQKTWFSPFSPISELAWLKQRSNAAMLQQVCGYSNAGK